MLPAETTQLITSIKSCMVEGMQDRWVWNPCSTGVYSTKTVYRWLKGMNYHEENTQHWRWVWRLKCPANIQFFIWQVCHSSIPTRGVLASRGIPLDASCPFCNDTNETLIHCLFDCPRVVAIWRHCHINYISLIVPDQTMLYWLHEQVSIHGVLFLCIMWKAWCSRNAFIFNGESLDTLAVALQAQHLNREISLAYGVDIQHQKVSRIVSWNRPQEGTACLNVDGSALSNPGMAGFGGLVRDSMGNFLCGFYGSIGHSNIMHAEVKGLLHGLQLCWEKGFTKLVCYSDSLHALKLIETCNQDFHVLGNEIALIRNLLRRNWEITIHHTLREGNQCADFLAKLGARATEDFIVVSSPPIELRSLLLADASGIAFVRS